MNKNFTKSHKNQKSNVKKSKEKIITPSKKTLDFILSYANTTKSRKIFVKIIIPEKHNLLI